MRTREIFDRSAVNFSQFRQVLATVIKENSRSTRSRIYGAGVQQSTYYRPFRNSGVREEWIVRVRPRSRSAKNRRYRLTQPWKIEFTIINTAYGGDRAAICHNKTVRDRCTGTLKRYIKCKRIRRKYEGVWAREGKWNIIYVKTRSIMIVYSPCDATTAVGPTIFYYSIIFAVILEYERLPRVFVIAIRRWIL